MATAVSGCWPRAASAGSLGQANYEALIGQSPLPLLAPRVVANMPDGDCGFWLLATSSFGGLFRSGESSGPDRTVAATAPGSPCGREHTRWRLRFLVVGSSSFGGFFRSGKSSGPARTVAATAPGSPCGREHARWRLRFLVVGREQLRRAF
jgi:hypothetical protein